MSPCVQTGLLVHQIVIDFVVKHVDTIYLETYELDQSWADHAVAIVCWDMIMNQWSEVFHFKSDIINIEKFLCFFNALHCLDILYTLYK